MSIKRAFCRSSMTIFFAVCLLSAQDKFPSRNLTSDEARNGFPSWSPDGKKIVYSYIDVLKGQRIFGLRKVSLEGGPLLPYTDFICEHPQWSPDGKYIVFDSDSGAGIRLISAEGGVPQKFLPNSIRITSGGLAFWSPEGSHLAFKDSSGVLWVYDLATSLAKRVFQKEGAVAIPGCWSQDGKGVLVALMDRKTRLSTLWNISADGTTQRQITGHKDSLYRYLALSPDGSLLIYGVLQGRRVGLWIMSSEGGGSLPLAVSDQYSNESPAWSPEGKRIAFASGRTGRGNIYVMDLDVAKVNAELKALGKQSK